MLFCTRAWNVKQWLSHSSGAEQAEIDSLVHCRTCLQHRKTFKKKKKKCIDSTNVETASYDERIGARCLYNCLCTLPHVRRHKLYRKRNGHRHTAVLVPHFALWHHTSSYCRVLHTAHARVPNKRTWCPCEKKEVERTKTRGSWSYSWDTSPVRFTSQKPCIQYAIHTEGSIRAPLKAHKLGLY